MTTAERIIKPDSPGIFRTVFLYTGQGESTLLVIPNGSTVNDYLYVLLDCDRDMEENEIDLISLFSDLFKNGGELTAFINTHPHNDHIGGIQEVYDQIGFSEVWHSNHKPGAKHKDKYEELKYVIDKVGIENEYYLLGTNDLNKIRTSNNSPIIKKLGNIDYQVLSPSEYLCDDINEENQAVRDRRIHEQCGVIKFSYGSSTKSSIIFTGDSDKTAWKDHITSYHKNALKCDVLSASHHGSRSFFKDSEDDEDIFTGHIEQMQPTYLIISAPLAKNSIYGHPHSDALELYETHIEDSNGIHHLGSGPYCVIVDIHDDGYMDVNKENELIKEYGNISNDEPSNENKFGSPYIASKTTRLDNKPMG